VTFAWKKSLREKALPERIPDTPGDDLDPVGW
jgi:hypothetical protein